MEIVQILQQNRNEGSPLTIKCYSTRICVAPVRASSAPAISEKSVCGSLSA